MTSLLIALGVLFLLLVIIAIVSGRRAEMPRSLSGAAHREAAMAAQADVEDHDIEQMIEARNALRRRIGRPEIGDELAEEARKRPADESN